MVGKEMDSAMMKITMLAATMMMEIAVEDVLHEDGFCHDVTNNADCCYDGGDYSGDVVNTEYQCLYGGTGGGRATVTYATTTII